MLRLIDDLPDELIAVGQCAGQRCGLGQETIRSRRLDPGNAEISSPDSALTCVGVKRTEQRPKAADERVEVEREAVWSNPMVAFGATVVWCHPLPRATQGIARRSGCRSGWPRGCPRSGSPRRWRLNWTDAVLSWVDRDAGDLADLDARDADEVSVGQPADVGRRRPCRSCRPRSRNCAYMARRAKLPSRHTATKTASRAATQQVVFQSVLHSVEMAGLQRAHGDGAAGTGRRCRWRVRLHSAGLGTTKGSVPVAAARLAPTVPVAALEIGRGRAGCRPGAYIGAP